MVFEAVESPLPGKVIKVHVAAGDIIIEGDKVCTIESMKMENPVLSPVGGRVAEVKVSVGQQVDRGQVLVLVEHQAVPANRGVYLGENQN
ncbi:MAG: acetyl-CoA carboxylase biotin carboxyl carrier protein subunit [Dehalococcoidia bacterium]|nr:acetyl-CoA carboxylase biotin carboxyl carrier protein subunit [Dehalococcoidia bacterium]